MKKLIYEPTVKELREELRELINSPMFRDEYDVRPYSERLKERTEQIEYIKDRITEAKRRGQ